MNQLFQFDGKLYEQIDGVAMGSRLGTFMANEFLYDSNAAAHSVDSDIFHLVIHLQLHV